MAMGLWRGRKRVAYLLVEVLLSREVRDGRIDAASKILKNHGADFASEESIWVVSETVQKLRNVGEKLGISLLGTNCQSPPFSVDHEVLRGGAAIEFGGVSMLFRYR